MCEIDNKAWKEYFILPVHKAVRFIPVKTKVEFDAVLKDYEAQGMEVKFSEIQNPEDERPKHGLVQNDFLKIKFYQLSNKLIAVDRIDYILATPYFICSSLDEFRLISDYLLMYFRDDGSFIIQCSVIYDQFRIKQFLQTEPLKFVEERSDSLYLLFIANDGKCVYVEYLDRKRHLPDIESYVQRNPELQNEEIIYSVLTIYESLTIMNKVGKFDRDYFDIDEENFESHRQRLFISEKKFVKTTILKKNETPLSIKENVKFIPQKFNASYQDTIVLNDEKVVAQYSPYIFMQFENEIDFRNYLSHLNAELGESYEDEPPFEFFEQGIRQNIDDQLVYSNLFGVDITNETLEQSLKLLDKKINNFFLIISS